MRHSDFKLYQCPHCKKTFGREHHLTSHMTHSHAAAMALEGDEGEREEAIVFKCSLYGEGYPRVSQLTMHIQVAHAADVSPPAPPTDPPLGEGPATEGVYSLSSSDEEAALLIREDDDAAEAGTEGEEGEGGGKSQAGPVFHCPYCPRTFSRQIYLDSHLFSHSEDRPHKCLLCGKGFSHVHHLKSHMTHRHPQAVVTNTTLATTPTPTPVEATFKCPCCRRSFKKDFHLKRIATVATPDQSAVKAAILILERPRMWRMVYLRIPVEKIHQTTVNCTTLPLTPLTSVRFLRRASYPVECMLKW